jgi:hypothetical protein
MTQVDFVLIRMGADLTVNMYTNMKFMRNKVTCRERYYSHHQQDVESGGGGGCGGGQELSSFHSDASSDCPMRRMLHPPSSSCARDPGDERPVFCIEEDGK